MGNLEGKTDQTLPDLILEQGQKSQFLLLGDTNHEDINIGRAALGPKSLDAMQKAGIKTLMTEYFTSSQNLIDAYADSRITRDQFKDILTHNAKPAANFDWDKEVDLMATLVENTHARGMKLIAVDGREGDYNALLNNEQTRRTNATLIQHAQGLPEFRVPPSLYDAIKGDVINEMYKDGSYEQLRYKPVPRSERPAIRLEGFEGRMNLDASSLAQRIYQSANNQPAAVFYGNWHFAKVNDVDEELKRLTAQNPHARPQATQVINIYKNPTDTLEAKNFCNEFNCAAQPEHLNFYLDSSSPDHGNKGYQPAAMPAPVR